MLPLGNGAPVARIVPSMLSGLCHACAGSGLAPPGAPFSKQAPCAACDATGAVR